MRYPFFSEVLKQLNRKLRYDATVAYAGNSFVKESGKMIDEANPMLAEKEPPTASEAYANQLTNLFNAGLLTVEKADNLGKED